MISEPSLSLSNAIFLSVGALLGVSLYAGFAYLVAHSNNVDVRRRWRYSILWGVSSGVVISIFFGVGSILVLLGNESELGYMAVFRSLRSPLDLFTGIVLFLVYPVLISLPIILIVTFGTYWQELSRGDLLINRLLCPVKKHPSDQASDSIFDQVRTSIAKLID